MILLIMIIDIDDDDDDDDVDDVDDSADVGGEKRCSPVDPVPFLVVKGCEGWIVALDDWIVDCEVARSTQNI